MKCADDKLYTVIKYAYFLSKYITYT